MKNKIFNKKILKIELSILTALIVSFSLSVVSFSAKCESIRSKVLRMHVIANSDEPYDQELKLKVRDAVLEKGKEIFDGSVTKDDAVVKIEPYITELENKAKEVITDNGFDYDVKIKVGEEYFNTRVYDNTVTLPAGFYTAVTVTIGEGDGKNWWCVMFPPMCLPAATAECELQDVLDSNEVEIVEGGSRYKYKFKIVELYEKFTGKFK